MSNTVYSLMVLAAFLLPGLIAAKTTLWFSRRRHVGLLEISLLSLSLSFLSYLILFPAYKDKYLAVLSSTFGSKQDLQSVISAGLLLVSLFIIPLLLGFILGILSRLRAFQLLLSLVTYVSDLLCRRQKMPISVVKASASVGSLCRSAMDPRPGLGENGEVWDSVFSLMDAQAWLHVPIGDLVYEGVLVEASGSPHEKQIYLENAAVFKEGKTVPRPEGFKGVLILFKEGAPQAIEIFE